MSLRLSPACESDAPRIAAIHMAAFGPNLLLRVQFPTAAIRAELEIAIAEKALADIRDTQMSILVVRDDHRNETISFAKWSLPVFQSERHEETPWRWPLGTNFAVLDAWTEKVERAAAKVLDGTPCFHLSFIGTDPQHERRGAASLLLRWGLEQCKRYQVPAYLESTADAGVLYRKHGFEVVETLAMVVEGVEGRPVVYKEECFIFRPSGVFGMIESSMQAAP